MTAQTIRETAPGAGVPATGRPPRPSMATLTLVELRKMTDTRAGRWLLGLIALTGFVLVGVIVFAAPADERTVADMYSGALTGVVILLPILGVLAVTSEWSQRTALTTFTLVPQRGRIAAAKILAAVALALLSVAVGVLAAWAGRVLAALVGRGEGTWGIPLEVLGTTAAYCTITILIGVAFGMVFLNSPVAIVMNFLLPVTWSILGESIRALDKPAGWLDINRTLEPFFEPGVTAGQWARVGVAASLWLLLPMAIGLTRLIRREIK